MADIIASKHEKGMDVGDRYVRQARNIATRRSRPDRDNMRYDSRCNRELELNGTSISAYCVSVYRSGGRHANSGAAYDGVVCRLPPVM